MPNGKRFLVLAHHRSGSTLLLDLLRGHDQVAVIGELLNPGNRQPCEAAARVQDSDSDDLVSSLKEELDKLALRRPGCEMAGFKVTPEQLSLAKLPIDTLAADLDLSHVVIVYRRNVLETLYSLRRAESTDVWVERTDDHEVLDDNEASRQAVATTPFIDSITVQQEELNGFHRNLIKSWKEVAKLFPLNVRPVFVEFEELQPSQRNSTMYRLFFELSLDPRLARQETCMLRQNPGHIRDKVRNYKQLALPELNIPRLFENAFHETVNDVAIPFLPAREPPVPFGGWTYRVAEPFVPNTSKQYVLDAVSGGAISSATMWVNQMAELLTNFLSVPKVQPCSNGYTSLQLAFLAAGVKEGHSVVTPAMTMVAVPNAVKSVGAEPLFADVEDGCYNPGAAEILAASNTSTTAVVVCHTYGVPADIVAISNLCKQKGWILIEDVSECLGVRASDPSGTPLGSFGDFACGSLYANKIISAGDGGFVAAKSPRLRSLLRSLVNHGFTGTYHFLHYRSAPNAKINGIGAAFACGSLKKINEVMAHRHKVSKKYRSIFESKLPPGATLMPECGLNDTPWVFGVEGPSKEFRTSIRQRLVMRGIETRDYFFANCLQPAFLKATETTSGDVPCPRAARLGSCGFYLPTHFNLTESDVESIANAVVECWHEASIDAEMAYNPINCGSIIRLSLCTSQDYHLEVRKFDKHGALSLVNKNPSHPMIEALWLQHDIRKFFFEGESGDQRLLYSRLNKAISGLKNLVTEGSKDCEEVMERLCSFLRYFSAYSQPCSLLERPWMACTLVGTNVPTTTERETQQFLCWLIKEMCASNVLEIGCWLGGTTIQLASSLHRMSSSSQHRVVFALDSFKWESWMGKHVHSRHRAARSGFLEEFKSNTKVFSQHIIPVTIDRMNEYCGRGAAPCPPELEAQSWSNRYIDIAFVDFTCDDKELAEVWTWLVPLLMPGRSVVVFNGFGADERLVKFVANHSSQLTAYLGTPHTRAKAFLFSEAPMLLSPDEASSPLPIPHLESSLLLTQRKVFCVNPPKWDHMQRDCWGSLMTELRSSLHHNLAPIAFISAVEVFLCDHEDSQHLKRPWIGIAHSTPIKEINTFVPDLQRLCTKANCIAALENCVGLITLTSVNAEYLRKNLPRRLRSHIPISFVRYAAVSTEKRPPCFVVPDYDESLPMTFPFKNVVLVGAYDRDYEQYATMKLPPGVGRQMLDDTMARRTLKKKGKDPDSVLDGIEVLGRLDEAAYDSLLSGDRGSLPVLTLCNDGPANTFVIECLQRRTPLLAPRMQCVIDYLGIGYPLLFEVPSDGSPPDVTSLLTAKRIREATEYLLEAPRDFLSSSAFVSSIRESAVIQSLKPFPGTEPHCRLEHVNKDTLEWAAFDVTIAVMSWKRVHNLESLLSSLLEQQDYEGRVEVIIWNNNVNESSSVQRIFRTFAACNSKDRCARLIDSSTNYYCTPRLSLPSLMGSSELLICDDDILPRPNFISSFLAARTTKPGCLLCLRGHVFGEHQMDEESPSKFWTYEHRSGAFPRFVDDNDPEQDVHFAHADACLVPRDVLAKVATVNMPDPTFALVDDYWFCFVMNHHFNVPIKKVHIEPACISRTEDSDTPGLALHTRSEVRDAKHRLYIHHMLQGWPFGKEEEEGRSVVVCNTPLPATLPAHVTETKMRFWSSKSFIGFNVNSQMSSKDMGVLRKLGVDVVRVGAVGSSERTPAPDMAYLVNSQGCVHTEGIEKLTHAVSMFEDYGLKIVLTLARSLATPNVWSAVSRALCSFDNVVGYDLINEPYEETDRNSPGARTSVLATPMETELVRGKPWTQISLGQQMDVLIRMVRKNDIRTPVILEPPNWGAHDALDRLPEVFCTPAAAERDFVLVAPHMFWPARLTTRRLNKGRYTFPGKVPQWDVEGSPVNQVDETKLREITGKVVEWSKQNLGTKHRVFWGEIGISRDTPGAHLYLASMLHACRENSISCFLYAFREKDWGGHDYELGPEWENSSRRFWEKNPLMEVIREAIKFQNHTDEAPASSASTEEMSGVADQSNISGGRDSTSSAQGGVSLNDTNTRNMAYMASGW